MSITDELRKYAHDCCARIDDDIHAIADRIDAEHQKALDEWKAEHGQMWLKGYSECHAELLEGNETLVSDLERCGWIRLPLDADNVPIHIGDVMEGVDKYDSLKKVMGEVTTISFDATFDPDDSRSVGIRVWSDDRRSYHTAYLDPRASVYRHYHAPTVEDVMVEFATDWEHAQDGEDKTAVLKEYAKRLTLAEGEDA